MLSLFFIALLGISGCLAADIRVDDSGAALFEQEIVVRDSSGETWFLPSDILSLHQTTISDFPFVVETDVFPLEEIAQLYEEDTTARCGQRIVLQGLDDGTARLNASNLIVMGTDVITNLQLFDLIYGGAVLDSGDVNVTAGVFATNTAPTLQFPGDLRLGGFVVGETLRNAAKTYRFGDPCVYLALFEKDTIQGSTGVSNDVVFLAPSGPEFEACAVFYDPWPHLRSARVAHPSNPTTNFDLTPDPDPTITRLHLPVQILESLRHERTNFSFLRSPHSPVNHTFPPTGDYELELKPFPGPEQLQGPIPVCTYGECPFRAQPEQIVHTPGVLDLTNWLGDWREWFPVAAQFVLFPPLSGHCRSACKEQLIWDMGGAAVLSYLPPNRLRVYGCIDDRPPESYERTWIDLPSGVDHWNVTIFRTVSLQQVQWGNLDNREDITRDAWYDVVVNEQHLRRVSLSDPSSVHFARRPGSFAAPTQHVDGPNPWFWGYHCSKTLDHPFQNPFVDGAIDLEYGLRMFTSDITKLCGVQSSC